MRGETARRLLPTPTYRVNLYTTGWIFILQGESLSYRVNLYTAGWIFILQDESLYCKVNLYPTGWIFILQSESLSYRVNLYTTVWIFILQGESLCRVSQNRLKTIFHRLAYLLNVFEKSNHSFLTSKFILLFSPIKQ